MASGDISRRAFNPKKHYVSVRMQQGRVIVDDDWNENERIAGEDVRRERVDVVGRCGSPDDGFRITGPRAAQGTVNFDIMAGTFYLGGLRLEMDGRGRTDMRDVHELAPFAVAGLGDEFLAQKDWLLVGRGPLPPAPKAGRYDLVYLEAWQQPVTAVEDRELLEVALGGPDTTTRMRLMRRVHVAADVRTDHCPEAWGRLVESWESTGRGRLADTGELVVDAKLKVTFKPAGERRDLCRPSVTSGYLGAENQAIRVQVVDSTHFTWGFDDAFPLYRVQVATNRKTVTLLTDPKDTIHQPRAGQVVEILPWSARLPNGEIIAEMQGHMGRVAKSFDPDTHELELSTGELLPAGFGSMPTGQARPPYFYMRVWDRGIDDTSPVKIPFQPDQAVDLGQTGVQVTFTGSEFTACDHWVIAARPETPNQVVPWQFKTGLSPHGVRRFYAPLAIIHWEPLLPVKRKKIGIIGRVVRDCRLKFRPLTEQIRFCHVGGEGQETQPGGQFTDRFSVSVTNALLPIEKAKVKFTVVHDEAHGYCELCRSDAVWQNELEVETDVEGVAWCVVRVGSTDLKPVRVTATLEEVPGVKLPVPHPKLYFTGSVCEVERCPRPLDELRADGVVVDPDAGKLSFEVTYTQRPLLVRYTKGIAYVGGCRLPVAAGSVVPNESASGQVLFVCKEGDRGVVKLIYKGPLPARHATIATIATYRKRTIRVVDTRLDLTHLDEKVRVNREAIAARRADRRQCVPLLDYTLPNLRYRDGRNYRYELGNQFVPQQLAFDGQSVWVAVSSRPRVVWIGRDSVGPGTSGSAIVGARTSHVAFDGNSHVWFTAPPRNRVLLVDVRRTQRLDGSIVVGAGPGPIAFDGDFMWVGNRQAMSVSIVNVANRQVDRVIDLREPGVTPDCLAFDGRYMWVGGLGGVVRVQKSEDTPEDMDIKSPVLDMAFDGSRMWLAGTNQVGIVDVVAPSGPMPPADIPKDSYPRGLVFDGAHMWVLASTGGPDTEPHVSPQEPKAKAKAGAYLKAQELVGTLHKFDAETGISRGSIVLDGVPLGGAFDGTHLWVSMRCYQNNVLLNRVQRILVG